MYDLILTDIQLPKMNGIHFMEVLKNQDNYNNQPIVAMTGRLNLSKEDYLNIGFSEVLTKPFNPKEFQDILLRFFDATMFKNTPISFKDEIDEKVLDVSLKEFNIDSLKIF